MSDCPLWQPQCVAQDAVGGAVDLANGARKAYDVGATIVSGTGRVLGAANDLTSPVGGLLGAIPMILLVLIGWVLWRLLAGGVRTVKTAGPAVVQGYTGVDVAEIKQRPAKSGERYGRQLRARRDARHGLGTHTGQTTTVVDRQDDTHGRPNRVVVCAAGPGEAQTALASRLAGHQWRPTGSKPCDLNRTQRHFAYTRKGTKK